MVLCIHVYIHTRFNPACVVLAYVYVPMNLYTHSFFDLGCEVYTPTLSLSLSHTNTKKHKSAKLLASLRLAACAALIAYIHVNTHMSEALHMWIRKYPHQIYTHAHIKVREYLRHPA
jgi:hypothetical protein